MSHSFHESGVQEQLSWVVLAPEIALELLGYWPSLPSSEDLTGLENSLPVYLTYRPGKSVLVIGRRPQFPATWTSLEGCWNVLTVWQLAVPSASEPTNGKVETVFYDLAMERPFKF